MNQACSGSYLPANESDLFRIFGPELRRELSWSQRILHLHEAHQHLHRRYTRQIELREISDDTANRYLAENQRGGGRRCVRESGLLACLRQPAPHILS